MNYEGRLKGVKEVMRMKLNSDYYGHRAKDPCCFALVDAHFLAEKIMGLARYKCWESYIDKALKRYLGELACTTTMSEYVADLDCYIDEYYSVLEGDQNNE